MKNIFKNNFNFIITNLFTFFKKNTFSTLKKNTLVFKILLTLRNIDINKPSIDIENLSKLLITIDEDREHLIVKEIHKKQGYHFHAIILLKKGISKNIYKKIFKNLLPEFEGKLLDIRGIKSIHNTITYILKDLNIKRLLIILNNIPGKNYFTTNIISFLAHINKKRETPLKNTLIIREIIKFDELESWVISRIENSFLYSNKKIRVISNWEISRNIKPKTTYLIDWIKKNLDLDYNLSFALEIVEKYNISSNHLRCLSHVIYGLILREGLYPYQTKSKNLIIIGSPNRGKTSIITILQKIINPNIFYFVGARKNDFRGYNSWETPLLVWDDVFGPRTNRSQIRQSWSKHLLLKVLGLEKIKVDVKYKPTIIVYPSYNIIITNRATLFQSKEDLNIIARLKTIGLNERRTANWNLIKENEFKTLISIVIIDLLISIDNENFNNFINYGEIHNVVCSELRYDDKYYKIYSVLENHIISTDKERFSMKFKKKIENPLPRDIIRGEKDTNLPQTWVPFKKF